MAQSLKLVNFMGTMPKLAAERLPTMAAQRAENVKLYAGDLLPYPTPKPLIDSLGWPDNTYIAKLHALRDPLDNTSLFWLSWDGADTKVDVVEFDPTGANDQRFYYTGDGVPKVSNFDLATTGSLPYPVGYYELGLPLPTARPIAGVAAFSTKSVATIGRDASNTTTIVTTADHGLSSTNRVTITGYSYVSGTYSQSGGTTVTVTTSANHGLTNGDTAYITFVTGNAVSGSYIVTVTGLTTFTVDLGYTDTTSGVATIDVGFNTENAVITVVDATTFTYYNVGPSITTYAGTTGRVDLAGSALSRKYVYTWFTPWMEESVPSEASEAVLVKEGEVVTITNLPTATPSAANFVRGLKIYRTITSALATDAEYFYETTLWFPVAIDTLERTGSTATVVTQQPHMFEEGDLFKINAINASYDKAPATVISVVDDYTFTYATSGSGTIALASDAGTIYHDVSQLPGTSTAQYWGDGGYDFVDNFDYSLLTGTLASLYYDPPPENLSGLRLMGNGVLCGFFGKTLCFSEPGQPHAWPPQYQINLEHDVVGVELVAGQLFVGTRAYPYLIYGQNPSVFNNDRIDVLYPCLNASSMVNMGYGIVYATHDGLASFHPSSGLILITKEIHNQDTWNDKLSPSSVVAATFGDAYFASFDDPDNDGGVDDEFGAFIYQVSKDGSHFVDITTIENGRFTAWWYDSIYDRFYFTPRPPSTGTETTLIYEWDNPDQPNSTMTWKSKIFEFADYRNFGAARVVADFTEFNLLWEEAATNWEDYDVDWDTADNITFKLWALVPVSNRELMLNTTIGNNSPFRLPGDYRSDQFEVQVSGSVRVRSIHLADTVRGLKGA